MPELKGRRALVTGSTSGIGLAVARAMAGAGADVILNGFGDAGEIEKIRTGIEKDFGVRAIHDGADMSVPTAIETMMASVAERFGPIDILVNNAGIQHVAPVEVFPTAQWDRIIAINLSAAFHTIRMALPGMRARKWGRIVNIASTHGLVASPNKSAYIAAKHGIVGLTKTVALEAAEDNVTANAICPGFVRTDLINKQLNDIMAATGDDEATTVANFVGEKHPTKKFVEVGNVAALAVFLCTEGAASITGAAMPVDAGWTAR